IERVHKVLSQARVNSVRVLLGLPMFLIDTDQFLSFAGVLAKTIVGDSIKPGRKARLAAKTADVFVGADERLLGEIVGQRDIGASELAQQAAHGRLMPTDQLGERVLVIVNNNSSNQLPIGKLHAPILRQRRRLRNVLLGVEFPHAEIAQPDEERNQSERPDTAFPVVHRAEPDHETDPDAEPESETEPEPAAEPEPETDPTVIDA